MTQQHTQTSHEWWKDKSDPSDRAAFTSSVRANLHEQHVAGWRRNVALCILVAALPVLFWLVTRA